MKVSCAPANLILRLKDAVVQIKHDYCSYMDVQHERLCFCHDHISVTVNDFLLNKCLWRVQYHSQRLQRMREFFGISNLQKVWETVCARCRIWKKQGTVDPHLSKLSAWLWKLCASVRSTYSNNDFEGGCDQKLPCICTIHSDSFILSKHSCRNTETVSSLIQIILTAIKSKHVLLIQGIIKTSQCFSMGLYQQQLPLCMSWMYCYNQQKSVTYYMKLQQSKVVSYLNIHWPNQVQINEDALYTTGLYI